MQNKNNNSYSDIIKKKKTIIIIIIIIHLCNLYQGEVCFSYLCIIYLLYYYYNWCHKTLYLSTSSSCFFIYLPALKECPDTSRNKILFTPNLYRIFRSGFLLTHLCNYTSVTLKANKSRREDD